LGFSQIFQVLIPASVWQARLGTIEYDQDYKHLKTNSLQFHIGFLAVSAKPAKQDFHLLSNLANRESF
jgi:hypothetical protein